MIKLSVKWIVVGVLGVALGVYLFWPASSVEDEQADETQRIKVETTPVRIGVAIARQKDFILEASATGVLQPWQQTEILAEVGGRVLKRQVEEGDYVHKGQVLLQLDDREQRVALQEARAAWLKALADYAVELRAEQAGTNGDTLELAQARKTLEEAIEAFKAGAIDDIALLEARRRVEAMEVLTGKRREEVRAVITGLAQAEQQLERARLAFERTRIRAPFSGRIANVQVEVGEYVSPGKSLFMLVDDAAMRVAVSVLEADRVWIKPGKQARVQIPALKDTVIYGEVYATNPLVDSKTGTSRVVVKIPNKNRRLLGGLFAFVRLETQRLPDRLVIPVEALLSRQGRDLVFVIKQGRAKWTYVTVGARTEDEVEIKKGLVPGDTVAVEGHFALAHDAPVEIVRVYNNQ